MNAQRRDCARPVLWTMIALCSFSGLRLLGAEQSVTVLSEDFESYADTPALLKFWSGGTAQLENNAPGGGQAAVHDGSNMNKHGGFMVQADATHSVILTADFYDYATNTDKRVTISLNTSGPENLSMGLNSGSSYVIRASGFSATTNWIPFRRNQKPMPGWHRFRAVMSPTTLTATLDFNADGKIDRSLEIPLTGPPPRFTQMRFGGLTARPSKGGPILVDNIRLEVVPVIPPPLVATVPAESTENPVVSPPSVTRIDTNSPNLSDIRPPTEPNASGAVATPVAVRSTANQVFWWILAALSIIIWLLLGVLLAIRRQARAAPTAQLALADAPPGAQPALLAEGEGEGDWRKRALRAEAVASKQAQILEEKVGPQLVEFAKEALVQGLYSQRNALLETQRRAQQALDELETRLSGLHLPQTERIEAYETRISELEKQLETRGNEMRELTRATLMLVKQKLEEEKARSSGRFN